MLFAIVDIETTGGHASSNGITEIGVVIYDGEKVIQRYETLVNPHQSIPYYIQKLTGITDEMVQLAPSFSEIAPELFELLQGKIFVAHNVNFDYSFLHHQFNVLGYQLHCPKLCTVRYARKVSPKLASYSLGKLCAHFQIPVQNRHRAGGDANATALLLQLLLKKDVNNHIHTMLKRQSREQMLPMNMGREQIEQLPLTPGVYYFHDAKDKVVYVGKAKMLKKRVVSHFSGNKPSQQRQEFLRNIHRISYQQCGTELMAAVLETIEIKRLWPRFNRAIKGFEAGYGLYLFEDGKGFLRIAVDRKHKTLQPLQIYYSRMEAMAELKRWAKEFELCYQLCFIDRSGNEKCSNEYCRGVCNGKETTVTYNERVLNAIAQIKTGIPSFTIREPSYFNSTDACILMENGKFYGMGYIPVDFDAGNSSELKEHLQQYPEYQFVRSMIQRYAIEQPQTVTLLP
jgi:DNA polymerase III subunit epsilon